MIKSLSFKTMKLKGKLLKALKPTKRPTELIESPLVAEGVEIKNFR